MEETDKVTLPILYKYDFKFPFEKSFVPSSGTSWLAEHWHESIYYSIAYVIVIFSLKYYMTNRKPFALNKPLILWNLGLSAFSIIAFIRTLPEFFHVTNNYGVYYSVCTNSFLTHDNVSCLWTFLFVLSKVVELGDTVFIVLRKQPLIFLHWYHHILTLMYSWYAFKELTPAARWFTVMNTFIHTIMYSYYGLKALKIRIPKSISAVITFSQILQMAVGCYVNYKSYMYLANNVPCAVSYTNITVSSLMYFSYFVLFVRFFYHSYMSKSKKKRS